MNPKARGKARKFALQALYEWQVSGNAISDIERHFLNDYSFKKTDTAYFHEIIHGVVGKIDQLDQEMMPFLDRPLQQLNMVELSILRMAIFELMEKPDVPTRVIINEAIELAKTFGTPEGYKYVNGVLDKVAAQVRKS
jgi:N utilization substance protein B